MVLVNFDAGRRPVERLKFAFTYSQFALLVGYIQQATYFASTYFAIPFTAASLLYLTVFCFNLRARVGYLTACTCHEKLNSSRKAYII